MLSAELSGTFKPTQVLLMGDMAVVMLHSPGMGQGWVFLAKPQFCLETPLLHLGMVH